MKNKNDTWLGFFKKTLKISGFILIIIILALIFLFYKMVNHDDKTYLMTFWIHFIAINLFTGGWIVKDSQRYSINKIFLAIPLIVTYLIGPIGLLLYWLIKIFYAKNINLYD